MSIAQEVEQLEEECRDLKSQVRHLQSELDDALSENSDLEARCDKLEALEAWIEEFHPDILRAYAVDKRLQEAAS